MLRNLVDEVRRRGLDADPVVRQRLARFHSRVEIMRFAGLRLLAALVDERDPGPSASISKVFWSEHQRELTEYAMEVLGPDAMLRGAWPDLFLGSRSHTIWGGTAEIQRNILGERVLGLPKEPRPPTPSEERA
jgi:alkylation response protein AidB-like acyl-CoA dehydrogenase